MEVIITKVNLKIVFCLIFFMFVSLSCVAAGDANQTNSIDDFSNHINDVENDTVIELDNDYVADSDYYFEITKPVTINGNNHTIDLNGFKVSLNVISDKVVFNNLNFINGNDSTTDSFITWSGNNGAINNCRFTNNNGSAIQWFGNHGSITDSEFTNSRASVSTLYWSGEFAKISNCKFINNTAKECDLVYLASSHALIENTYFIANNVFDGTVVSLNGKKSKVDSCVFLNNNAGFSLIYADSDGFKLAKSDFTNNNIGFSCALISGDNVKINDCGFINNNAEDSTAIDLRSSNSIIKNCLFKNNRALYGNGAVSVNGHHNRIVACDFISNRAAYNGALAMFGPFSTIEKSNFIENSAFGDDTGAVLLWGYKSGIISCNFISNTAARDSGALSMWDNSSYIKNSKFISNHANGDGGAVYWSGDYGSIIGCYFENNTAERGGAIFSSSYHLYIKNCEFVNNSADEGSDIFSLFEDSVFGENSGELGIKYYDDDSQSTFEEIHDADDDVVIDSEDVSEETTVTGSDYPINISFSYLIEDYIDYIDVFSEDFVLVEDSENPENNTDNEFLTDEGIILEE